MKKITIIKILLITIFSCCKAKDYVTITGKVEGDIKELTLTNSKENIDKKIKINKKGKFKDTIKLKKPTYLALSDGDNMTVVYFKNGDKIKANIDRDKFSDIQYQGKGFEESAYMSKKAIMQSKFYDDSLYHLTELDFDYKLFKYSNQFKTELEKANDSLFKVKQEKYIKSFEKRARKTYNYKSYLLKNLGLGMVAPDFTYPYEDINQKKFLLKNFKGKYLYIKFWATWCGYCKKEAPYFRELSEQYIGENIEFVSISIDKSNFKQVWKGVVQSEEDFNGIELFSGEDKKFNEKYKISEIPRFLIIDTEGNIIDSDAPAPSSEEINTILDRLL